jgi:hypothetical protein
MEVVTVATFNEPQDAEPIVERLKQCGILARVHDERKIQKYWFVSRPHAGIRIQVPKEQFLMTEQLLQEWHVAERVLDRAIRCPECGSSRIEYPQFSRNSIIPNSVLGLFMLVGMVDKEFYCQECQHTWPATVKIEPSRDALGWPEKRSKHPKHART